MTKPKTPIEFVLHFMNRACQQEVDTNVLFTPLLIDNYANKLKRSLSPHKE